MIVLRCYNTGMFHLKGHRFGLPLIARLGVLNHLGTYGARWNSHPAPELHYVLKGESAWEVKGRKEPLRLSGGLFSVIPANIRHRAFDDRGAPAVRLGITLADRSYLSADGNLIAPEDIETLYSQLSAASGIVFRMPPKLMTRVRELAESVSANALSTPLNRLHLRVLAMSVLDETLQTLQQKRQPILSQDNVISSICSWIEKHCTDPTLSPEKLVTLSGYGRSRFFDLFLRETGMTPRDYIVRMRLSCAQRRMKGTKDTLSNIALDCGFASTAAFSSVFRRHTGISPNRWRNLNDSSCPSGASAPPP